MSRSRLTMLLLGMLLCAGCQMGDVGSGFVENAPSPELLAALKQRLAAGQWKQNLEWSSLDVASARDDAGSAQSKPARWVFGSGDVVDAITELDDLASREKTESAPDGDSSPAAKVVDKGESSSGNAWDGFAPLPLGELLSHATRDTDSERRQFSGDEYLRWIAQEESAAGWNAAILLAMRSPGDSAEMVPIVARLAAGGRRSRSDSASAEARGASDQESRIAELIDELLDGHSEAAPAEANDKRRSPLREMLAQLPGAAALGTPEEGAASSPAREGEIPLTTQAAAAAAWCGVLAALPGDPLENLAPVGEQLERTDLPDPVRAEMYRALSEVAPPALSPRLANAFEKSSDGRRAPQEIRRAAIDACLLHAAAIRRRNGTASTPPSFDPRPWPSTIFNSRNDPDEYVRVRLGRWLALVKYRNASTGETAVDLLKQQLLDADPRVRNAALVSLGVEGSDEARTILREFAHRPQEMVRAAAARGLAVFGSRELAPLARDESAQVRQAVAEELTRIDDVQAALLLRDLLVDPNLQVQTAIVDGLAKPRGNRFAVPLLLWGVWEGVAATSDRCVLALKNHRSFPQSLPDSANRTARREFAMQLSRAWNVPIGLVDELAGEGLRPARPANDVRRAELLADLKLAFAATDDQLRAPEQAAALERIRRLTADDVPIVEAFLADHPSGVELLTEELLPNVSEPWAALRDLRGQDLLNRRRAASRLAALAQQATLSRMVLRALRETLAGGEQDQLVWVGAMNVVLPDNTEEGANLALLALNNPWPDIRRLGCAYVDRHARFSQALWVQPLFDDPNHNVRLAAIDAAGRCGNPAVAEDRGRNAPGDVWLRGLRSLLSDARADIRFAAAVSLSRLGDRQGMMELERAARHPEPQMRERAIRAMGETGQERFLGPLIEIAWTESHVLVRRALLQSLEQLTAHEDRPAGLQPASDYDTTVRLWAAWWESRRRGDSAAIRRAETGMDLSQTGHVDGR